MSNAEEIQAQQALINNAFKKWINPLFTTPQYTDLQQKTYMAEPLLSNYIQHNATIRKISLKKNIDCGFYKDKDNYIKFFDNQIFFRKNRETKTFKLTQESNSFSFEFMMEKKENNGSQFSISIDNNDKEIIQIPESTFNFNTMFPVVFERENINVNDYIHYT